MHSIASSLSLFQLLQPRTTSSGSGRARRVAASIITMVASAGRGAFALVEDRLQERVGRAADPDGAGADLDRARPVQSPSGN